MVLLPYLGLIKLKTPPKYNHKNIMCINKSKTTNFLESKKELK